MEIFKPSQRRNWQLQPSAVLRDSPTKGSEDDGRKEGVKAPETVGEDAGGSAPALGEPNQSESGLH
eukprot:102121-Heterocapsa_arctica.AAC.1